MPVRASTSIVEALTTYGQKDVFSAMSLETGPLIGHDSLMCKDQEYVKNYTYDLISHVLYQCAFLTLTVYNS